MSYLRDIPLAVLDWSCGVCGIGCKALHMRLNKYAKEPDIRDAGKLVLTVWGLSSLALASGTLKLTRLAFKHAPRKEHYKKVYTLAKVLAVRSKDMFSTLKQWKSDMALHIKNYNLETGDYEYVDAEIVREHPFQDRQETYEPEVVNVSFEEEGFSLPDPVDIEDEEPVKNVLAITHEATNYFTEEKEEI